MDNTEIQGIKGKKKNKKDWENTENTEDVGKNVYGRTEIEGKMSPYMGNQEKICKLGNKE